MGDIASQNSDLGSPTDAKRTWLSAALGVDIKAGQGGGSGSPPPAPSTAAPSPVQPSGKAPSGTSPVTTLRGVDETLEKIAGKNTDVPRAKVETELKDFLRNLAKAQKTKSVRTTDKVWEAEIDLRLGLDGEPFVQRGASKDYDPDDLAHKIAAQLPDTIPRANYDRFLKLKPIDIPDAGSTTDQLRKKYEEKRDQIVHKLPKALQGPAKKAMDAAIEKGVPFVADKALKALGADSNLEGEMKTAVDAYAKKVTGNTSGDDQ